MTSTTTETILRNAADTALHAPSIFNTQPWRWQVRGDTLELRADRSRGLPVTDPEGRMLTVSCGAALHHALVALAADGHGAHVERLPDESDPDLLARITLPNAPAAGVQARVRAARLRDAIADRHTDRRPFADTPVPGGVVDRLRAAAEARGVYVAELDADALVRFQVTAARAGELDEDDPAYQAELAAWTHRPEGSGDGVQVSATVAATPRTVPLRVFFPDGAEGPLPGSGQELPGGGQELPGGGQEVPGSGQELPDAGHDGGARYLVLWTTDDAPADWLAAGEAMSAALLETTASGLAASPMTDVVEVPASRVLLHRLLDNLGQAQAALRIGVPATGDAAPASPRRAADEVIGQAP